VEKRTLDRFSGNLSPNQPGFGTGPPAKNIHPSSLLNFKRLGKRFPRINNNPPVTPPGNAHKKLEGISRGASQCKIAVFP
jgi:hypothetical protein